MSNQRFIAYGIGLLVMLLYLAACGTSSTDMAPTATDTPELPTATPYPTPTNTPVNIEASMASIVSESLLPVTKTENVIYAQRTQPQKYDWKLDEYTPTEPGAWPAVIFIHGLGGSKSYYQDLGQTLASQGTTVFIISYPDIPPIVAIDGNARGYREMTETAACAIRYAHTRAMALGHDTPSITIAGFSLGGGLGSFAALVEDRLESRWEAYAASNGGEPQSKTVCESDGRIEVDGLVGIAGAYDVFVGSDGKHGREEWLQTEDDELWTLLHSAIGENSDIKIRLLHGKMDFDLPYENAAAFEAALVEAGYDVELIQFGEGHRVPMDLTIQTVLDVVKK